jgi:glycine/D-amino acid oxidase-like deaminating enzyme
MQTDAGKNVSIWMATADMPLHAVLESDAQADVCVIGAGIAGLTVAYRLAGDGRSVVVLDDGPVGGGETSRTTAHLVSVLDEGYAELERVHGRRGAELAAQSHAAAVDAIEGIAGAEAIDCDFLRVPGYLFCPPGESTDVLAHEREAARRAGLAVEYVEHIPVASHDFGPALRFPNQAQFHVLKYVRGLAEAVIRRGGRIYTGARAVSIEGGKNPMVETAAGMTVSAGAVVVATNTPVNDRVAMHTKQSAYRTYVLGARVPVDSLPSVLLWDTQDPYHYVRIHRGNGTPRARDWLIVGGEDHKTGQANDSDARYQALEAWARERFPMLEDVPLRWSGQVMEPVDGLGFIGRNPGDDNVYIATGDSGNGMTHGTIAGLLIPDLIAGRDHAWAPLYDPSRKSLRTAGEYVRENLNVAAQYADYLKPAEAGSTESIAAGEGAVVRRGVKLVAAYRDEAGTLHSHSAVCTHLACIVHWNATEKTWDCPCHGSRFDKMDGHVLNGPAVNALASEREE